LRVVHETAPAALISGIINRVYIGGKIMPGADSRIVEKALEQADALASQK